MANNPARQPALEPTELLGLEWLLNGLERSQGLAELPPHPAAVEAISVEKRLLKLPATTGSNLESAVDLKLDAGVMSTAPADLHHSPEG